MDSYDKQQIVIRYMTKRMMKKFGMTKHNAEIEVAELLGLHPEELEYSHPEIDWDAKHEQMIPELERKNLEFLNELGLDYASIWTTPVMLRKSTIDATAPVRVLLKTENFHDYATQPQGQEFKVMRPITMVGDMLTETKISLYRPVTKTGDPRCWVYGMTKICSPGDELVFIFRNKKLYLLNISRFDYRNSGIDCELFSVVELSATAKELLEKIKTISDSQYLPVTWRHGEKLADTDVGRAIETALGININSSKKGS